MLKNAVIITVILFLVSCGGGEEFTKNPVDILIRDMTNTEAFSIILYDMDADGNFSKSYFHQYRIIKTEDDNLQDSIPGETTERISEWYAVPRQYFEANVDNMGMEIASKNEDGKVSKIASPPGYSNYVGNSRYGSWQTHSNGYSFWQFYGQYAFMSAMFNMATFPVRRSYYNDYNRDYYGRRPYYGPTSSGRTIYGTNGRYTNQTRRNSTWSKNPNRNSFTNRVNNSVSRSNSRYNSSSSMRSRSGGMGK